MKSRPLLALLALMALQVAPTAAQSTFKDEIRPALDAWRAAAEKRAPGTWGVVVADETGEVLWSINADRGMTPASTVKILTTGFARTVVGGTARRATRVVGTGAVHPATGIWEGHWALELNGDPTLERPDRAGPSLRSLARQLHQIGVRQLIGPLILTTQVGEPSARYPAVWSARHRGRAFAPLVGPITLNENLVAFTIAPGSRAGEAPRVSADAPRGAGRLVTMEARTVAGTRNRLVVRQRAGGDGPSRAPSAHAPRRAATPTSPRIRSRWLRRSGPRRWPTRVSPGPRCPPCVPWPVVNGASSLRSPPPRSIPSRMR